MSAKAISEATGKGILNKALADQTYFAQCKFASVNLENSVDKAVNENAWLTNTPLVVKPDQLIKRRGKLGLIKVKADLPTVKTWIDERLDKNIQIGRANGKLRNFIIEPFVPHAENEESYVCIYSHRQGDTILFHHQGGVDIGDVDAKAKSLLVSIDHTPTVDEIKSKLLTEVTGEKKEMIAKFITALYKSYVDLYFTYLEINPLVITGGKIYMLDLAAKIDATADFICRGKWGEIEYPPPFGRDAYPEEAYIADLDAKSGASLKLTLLNPAGRIWTMVAGGGASVVYSDTVCEMGGASELANYGEYSGAPSEQQTYEYAKTILSLMTKQKHPQGKVLIIGGGIANFTNVASTFKGIVTALQEFQTRLQEHKISIFVRRAGPNYQEGLRVVREAAVQLGIPMHVFGPESHMTAIVGMALGKRPIVSSGTEECSSTTANFLLPSGQNQIKSPPASRKISETVSSTSNTTVNNVDFKGGLFSRTTKSIIWGMQTPNCFEWN